MRKTIATTFCTLMLCSLLLLTVGAVMAAEPGYERFSRPTQVIPTIDGMWTSDDEWTDGEWTWIGTDVAFTSTWDMGDDVMTRWIVEFLTDTTDGSGDLWRFCLDGTQVGSSGNVRMFEITDHTDFTWYLKIGASAWTEQDLTEDEIEWANSLSASPNSDTPHWILEFQIPKNTGQIQLGIVWNFLLQVSDSGNPKFLAWPPTDPDNADTWGIENYSSEAIPEGLTFGVMALLSSISVIVGYKYFIKRKETKVAA